MPRIMLTLLCLACSDLACHGQLPQVQDSRLGVDLVKLTSGERIYGFVLAELPGQSLQVAIERVWLESTYPKLFEERLAKEVEEARRAREELTRRIESWIAERQGDDALIRFLKSRLTTLRETPPEDLPPTLFMAWEIPRDQIRERAIAKVDRRQIAGLAYQHGLENVVNTPAALLRKQLEKLGVNVTSEQVDLSAEVPQVRHQSERQWVAKKALVEFQMREELIYQGSGSALIRQGTDQPDVGALMGQMLGGGSLDAIQQLGAELGLPEFKPRNDSRSTWWRKATREAEQEGFLGVLVTRLKQSMLSPEVVVETVFLAKDSPGNWFPVVEIRSAANAQQQPPERIARIREDPQIKNLLDTLSGLGLAVDDRLDQALRHGAATEQALQNANSQFYTFLGNHTRSLDGPPIELKASQ